MLYNTLLSVTAFILCLSLFLVYRASVLENDFRKLQGDIILQLNQPHFEGLGDGRIAKMSQTREDNKLSAFHRTGKARLKSSFRRSKRQQGDCRAPQSILQLSANTNKQPYVKGSITVIPWSVAVQRGQALSARENRIVVQEDGYYLVFGQVLFHNPDLIMGHVVRIGGSATSGKISTRLLRCMQEMSHAPCANTCYTSKVVKLDQDDELELVIPNRPQALIAMDADSTFFGIIQLK